MAPEPNNNSTKILDYDSVGQYLQEPMNTYRLGGNLIGFLRRRMTFDLYRQ